MNNFDYNEIDSSDLSLPVRGSDEAGNLVFMPYDSKAPIEEKGLRTAKITYKRNMKTGTILGKNSCLLVPFLETHKIADKIEELMPYFKEFLESEQDKIIKDLHLSGVNKISPAQISLDSIIKNLKEAKLSSARMTKEVISSWFVDKLEAPLVVLFSDKLAPNSSELNEDQEAKVKMLVTVYKNKFSGLASNLVTYQKEEAEKLIIALDKVSELEEFSSNDIVLCKVKEKLNKMIKPVNLEEFLGL